jgi:hypothetical protein
MSTIPMVGASGAIAGVMGGYLLLFPRARVDVIAIIIIIIKRFTIPAWVLLAVWFGIQIVSSLLGADQGVAYMAHIAGFIAGIVLAVPLFLRRGGPAFWNRTHGRPPHPAIDYSRSRIPQVQALKLAPAHVPLAGKAGRAGDGKARRSQRAAHMARRRIGRECAARRGMGGDLGHQVLAPQFGVLGGREPVQKPRIRRPGHAGRAARASASITSALTWPTVKRRAGQPARKLAARSASSGKAAWARASSSSDIG